MFKLFSGFSLSVRVNAKPLLGPVPFINTALTKLSISLCCSDTLKSKKPICSNEKTAGELSSAVFVTVFSCVMRISDCSELFPLLLG